MDNLMTIGIFIASIIIFASDIFSPTGVSVNILYLIPIYLTSYQKNLYSPFIWSAALSILSMAASGFSYRILPTNWEMIDRILTIAVLWISAAIIHQLRQKRESALKDRSMALEATLAKARFLAAASHDLRQPLQSMLFFSAALHAGIKDEATRQTLTLLERSLGTLKVLLDRLFEISRLDNGRDKPEFETIRLRDVLDDVSTSFTPVAAGKGLEFSVTDGGVDVVRSDPVLLGRMIRNLVENAIRYTAHGSIQIRCRADGDAFRVDVCDTGMGIPADQVGRIFDEFHRIENTGRNDREPGLGLGLSIVRRLSILLDHPIEVHSVPGAGTVMSIRIPQSSTESKLESTGSC